MKNLEIDLCKLPTIARYIAMKNAMAKAREEFAAQGLPVGAVDVQIVSLAVYIGTLLLHVSRTVHGVNNNVDPFASLPLPMLSIVEDISKLVQPDLKRVICELGEKLPPGTGEVAHILKPEPKDPTVN